MGFGSISLSIQATNKNLSCRIGTLLGSSVWSEVRAGLAAQSARLRLPAHRSAARVRGDDGRGLGNPHPDLARQARDRTAGRGADRCRDEVGGRDGPPDPSGRRPGQALGRQQAVVQHMRGRGAAPRRGGGRPRDGVSLPGRGHHQAGVRVPGGDGGADRRNAPGDVG